ncbi:hypothetical protein TNCV_868571 [Trichonephila clavipes]|nr:hypothetical protein TNCV_868571 [Trichonephila clavipes]
MHWMAWKTIDIVWEYGDAAGTNSEVGDDNGSDESFLKHDTDRVVIGSYASRLQLFINTYMVIDVIEEFNRKNVKNLVASNIPTCKSELLQ